MTGLNPTSPIEVLPASDVPDPQPQAIKGHTGSRVVTWAAGLSLLAFALITIWQLGGFKLEYSVSVDGRTVTIPNTFATVDHPFHATRADTLLKSLQNGQLLRWIGNHQGGYPVEFYPLGMPWLEVGLWAALLGTFPIVAVHKLAVLIVFVLPAVAFWILARGDRLHPFVPLLALAFHVALPGFWTNGGLLEVVEWGLVANVAGASLALIAFAALSRFVFDGMRWYAVLAIASASVAMYTNSRSMFAIAAASIAIVLAGLLRRDPDRTISPMLAARRIALVGGASMLLTAPLLAPMVRYGDLYTFVHFMEYRDLATYWDNILLATSGMVVTASALGILLGLLGARLAHLRSSALAVVLFGGMTVLLSSGGLDSGLIQQLETPRLMPFQRLLTVYLAAAAIGWLLDRGVRLVLPQWREYLVAVALVAGSIVAARSSDGAFGETPVQNLTSATPLTGVPEFVDFMTVIQQAEQLRPAGTAMYVVGDQESWWHEQLWAPAFSEARFFYDDWLWYWHPDFDGPYDYRIGHAFLDPAQSFTPEWLSNHGVGVVVVTNMRAPEDPRHAAQHNPSLEFQATVGYWDIYLVRNPGSIVVNGQTQPTDIVVENERISATFENASGTVEVRHNWFPRWEATADGQAIPVERTDDGFMRVTVPDGTRQVEFRYVVTGLDWAARIAAIGGLGLSLAIGIDRSGRIRRLWQADPAGRQDPIHSGQ